MRRLTFSSKRRCFGQQLVFSNRFGRVNPKILSGSFFLKADCCFYIFFGLLSWIFLTAVLKTGIYFYSRAFWAKSFLMKTSLVSQRLSEIVLDPFSKQTYFCPNERFEGKNSEKKLWIQTFFQTKSEKYLAHVPKIELYLYTRPFWTKKNWTEFIKL